MDPPAPKVKIANLMRVLGMEAVQDPTKVLISSVAVNSAKKLALFLYLCFFIFKMLQCPHIHVPPVVGGSDGQGSNGDAAR